jgi:hypothetical protein
LLYRLSGDKTTFHADPVAAARAGFPRPILHGLCTYGIVAKAVIDLMAGGEAGRLRRYLARFSGVVFPGDTLAVSLWRRDGDVDVAVDSDSGTPALCARRGWTAERQAEAPLRRRLYSRAATCSAWCCPEPNPPAKTQARFR